MNNELKPRQVLQQERKRDAWSAVGWGVFVAVVLMSWIVVMTGCSPELGDPIAPIETETSQHELQVDNLPVSGCSSQDVSNACRNSTFCLSTTELVNRVRKASGIGVIGGAIDWCVNNNYWTQSPLQYSAQKHAEYRAINTANGRTSCLLSRFDDEDVLCPHFAGADSRARASSSSADPPPPHNPYRSDDECNFFPNGCWGEPDPKTVTGSGVDTAGLGWWAEIVSPSTIVQEKLSNPYSRWHMFLRWPAFGFASYSHGSISRNARSYTFSMSERSGDEIAAFRGSADGVDNGADIAKWPGPGVTGVPRWTDLCQYPLVAPRPWGSCNVGPVVALYSHSFKPFFYNGFGAPNGVQDMAVWLTESWSGALVPTFKFTRWNDPHNALPTEAFHIYPSQVFADRWYTVLANGLDFGWHCDDNGNIVGFNMGTMECNVTRTMTWQFKTAP